jgi:aminomethyltransferase
VAFVESLVVGDIAGLAENQSTLSLFTNEKGGIIDDTVVMRKKDHLYVVSNAGCADKILGHLKKQLDIARQKGMQVNVDVIDTSLVALQGPKACATIEALTGMNLSTFPFMTGREMKIAGIDVHIARCGYTGEDGFEISVPSTRAVEFCEKLLSNPQVKLAGLGARDSLRLEAGLCLYGHDINEETTPVEAGLTWTIGKKRREQGGFIGSDVIIPQIGKAVPRRRVGLIIEGAPAREGAKIYSKDELIGILRCAYD